MELLHVKRQEVYLLDYTHTHRIQFSVRLHSLLVESPISSRFRVNSVTSFGHTGPSSGVYCYV
jgi:hypothetical protein